MLLPCMVSALPVDYSSTPSIPGSTVIDSRASAVCEAATLKNARCLPADDFLGPHKRLANISGMLWLLGTAGLTGSEHVLVIGDESQKKEFLAGLLYIAGQNKITVLSPAVTSLQTNNREPGERRSKTRESVYQATMRSEAILLRTDLIRLLQSESAPRILDGRREMEYLGLEARAPRGGHLPGAQHLPLINSNAGRRDISLVTTDTDNEAIAYAYDSFEGLVYLSRLLASGVNTRLYLEGWAGWASDGALPADLVTYPRHRRTEPGERFVPKELTERISGEAASVVKKPRAIFLGFAGLALFFLGLFTREVHSRLLTKSA